MISREGGIHFQFLVNIPGIQAHMADIFSPPGCIGGVSLRRQILHQLPQFGNFHNQGLPFLHFLCLYYHTIVGFAMFIPFIAISIL